MSSDMPAMPRDPEAAQPTRGDNRSPHSGRDRAVLEQLLLGDGRALASLLLEGHIPGPAIRQCLALMLLDWPEAEAAVAAKPTLNQALWRLPFRFVAKARPRRPGRRRNEGATASAQNIYRLVEELSYDAAIARVNEAVLHLIETGRDNEGSKLESAGEPR